MITKIRPYRWLPSWQKLKMAIIARLWPKQVTDKTYGHFIGILRSFWVENVACEFRANLHIFRGASLSRLGHVTQSVSQSVRDALVKFQEYKVIGS